MSYDLAVFEPTAELRDRSTFMRWYASRTAWRDGLDYSNASNATPALQSWHQEMTEVFPPPDSVAQMSSQSAAESDRTAEYVIGIDIVYVAFRWNKAGLAYETTRRLAGKHAVGFFNASGDRGEVWFPSGNGRLELIHEGPIEDEGQGSLVKQAAEAKKRSDIVHCESMEDLVTQMLEMDPANPKVIIVEPTPPKSK